MQVMDIELSGLISGMFLIAAGLALMGYFIGKGLQNLGQPDKGNHYNLFVAEEDLEYYFNLNKNEIEELLKMYPGAPKVELDGKTYYPYRKFMDWISSQPSYKVNR